MLEEQDDVVRLALLGLVLVAGSRGVRVPFGVLVGGQPDMIVI